MSKHELHVDAALQADANEARKRLEHLLTGGPHQIWMRLPLHDFGVPGDLTLEKNIVANATIERDPLNINDDIHITFWAATASNAFPTFSGVIDVYPGDSGSILELRGSYETPFATAGDLFDSTIGNLIAQRCAKALLEDLAEKVRFDGAPAL